MASPYDFSKIDELVHTRMRLAVLTYLASVDDADFKAILAATGATDGNLSVHLTKLETAGYIEITKSFRGRRPNTRARITDDGRDALVDYINHVEQVFDLVRGKRPKRPKRPS